MNEETKSWQTNFYRGYLKLIMPPHTRRRAPEFIDVHVHAYTLISTVGHAHLDIK